MKKLLQVLASVSLTVTLPLNVVSCKSEKTKINEFDYSTALNSFMEDVTTIFRNAIWEAFRPFAWVSEESLPVDLTIQELLENESELQDSNSAFFKRVSEQIFLIVPNEKINSQIASNITNNVNYTPLIIDSSNPLRDGINIEEIKILKKDSQNSNENNLSVSITFSTQVYYAERMGGKTFQKISTEVSINIFAKKTSAQKAQEISDLYSNFLNKNLANEYSFESGKGRHDEISDEINNSEYLKKQFSKDIRKIQSQNSDIQEMNLGGLEASVIQSTITNASRYKTESRIANFDDRLSLLNKALCGDTDSQEVFLRNASNDDTGDWIRPIINDPEEKTVLDDAIEKDSTISRSINQYNLKNNLKENFSVESYLSNQNSEFEIDESADKSTIAVYGVEFKGVQFKMDGDFYDFSDQLIFLRQKTDGSTKKLYEDFIENAFLYQQDFYNMQKFPYKKDYWDQTYFIRQKKNKKAFKDGTRYQLDENMYYALMNGNPLATSRLKEKGFNAKMENNQTGQIPSYVIYCISKGVAYLHFFEFDKPKTQTNDVSLRTYFFSNGNSMSNTTSFYFTSHEKREKVFWNGNSKKFRKDIRFYKSMFNVDFYE
ncbi:hypothetical protein [Spiroplasma alleghenense]|uniref:Uncharacterized protein n=1 Tax=Spiroplasma alleghenense TaxID=216931 RepID=A0A345Z4A3_9MOLU|nr:hypothetical protein [Spiroplasma alleghenense]AXK51432.1 hypothetical protein SALLE_v1c07620 [Spiroplasma alleghenense]